MAGNSGGAWDSMWQNRASDHAAAATPRQPGRQGRSNPHQDPATRRMQRPGRPPPPPRRRNHRRRKSVRGTGRPMLRPPRSSGHRRHRRPGASPPPPENVQPPAAKARARQGIPQPPVHHPDRGDHRRAGGRRPGRRRALRPPPRRRRPRRCRGMRCARRRHHLIRRQPAVSVAAHHRPLHQHLRHYRREAAFRTRPG